jgi:4-aminobutyrate--pyruvate transaminase
VGEARGIGLIGAVEVVQDKAAKTPFPAGNDMAAMAAAAAFRNGVIARAIRGAIAFCPPLIIAESEIDELFDGVTRGLDEALMHAKDKGLV